MRNPAIARARARLDLLDWYPRPVRAEKVRLIRVPWFFRLPWLRRFDGFALHGTVLVRDADPPNDLVVHELCHVWQMQHRPLAMPLSYLRVGYTRNPYEREARAAVELTRRLAADRGPAHRRELEDQGGREEDEAE